MKAADIEPFFATLKAANPDPASELEYTSVFELLTAVLLSAQATDASVNKATRALFPVAHTPAAILASTKRIFQGDATRAIVNLHTADPAAAPKLATALKEDVSKFAGKRTQQAAVSFAKLPPLPRAGSVTRMSRTASAGVMRAPRSARTLIGRPGSGSAPAGTSSVSGAVSSSALMRTT